MTSYKFSSLPKQAIDYESDQAKDELFGLFKGRLNKVVDEQYGPSLKDLPEPVMRQLKRLPTIVGKPASLLHKRDHSHRLFTVLANRVHHNITRLFNEKSNRILVQDTITVTKGFEGDYPSVCFTVASKTLAEGVDQVAMLETESDYSELVSWFGIRRTNPKFWQASGVVYATYWQQQPENFGWLDYNRYDNR